jgi:RNA polymerase sigma-70 factor (ECF subfamily)
MEAYAADAELIAQAAEGRREAFQTLAERYYRPLCGFLWKRCNDRDLVEDLAQETFLEAYKALRDGTRPEHLSSWLFGIAFNRLSKWFRRKKPALFSPDDPPEETPSITPDLALEEFEEQQLRSARLRESLQELPEDIQQLLALKHQDGLTCEEIAQRLGRPVNTIKSQLARTYHALRARLRPAEDES